VLELVAVLSNGGWCRTSYLSRTIGSYIRPEIAWRTGQGNINCGQRLYVNAKLLAWERVDRVGKRRNGKFVEWRLAKSDWTLPYLLALIEILREQAKAHSWLPVRRSRILDRIEQEQEIVRLQKEGLSQRQIAQKLGCHQSTVSLVLKASAVQVTSDEYSSLSLLHRVAIAGAPLEKQPEIARKVTEQRLTLEQTRKIVRRMRG
jgi:predicted XRE-type DNA-binding protein